VRCKTNKQTNKQNKQTNQLAPVEKRTFVFFCRVVCLLYCVLYCMIDDGLRMHVDCDCCHKTTTLLHGKKFFLPERDTETDRQTDKQTLFAAAAAVVSFCATWKELY